MSTYTYPDLPARLLFFAVLLGVSSCGSERPPDEQADTASVEMPCNTEPGHRHRCRNGRGGCQTPTCDDGVKNGAETDADCGGPDCEPCADGSHCIEPTDCAGGVCTAGICGTEAASCTDGVQNGEETGVDCGGGCRPCSDPRCEEPVNPCLDVTYVDRTGECAPYPVDGIPCVDGDPATTDEICIFGACVASTDPGVDATCAAMVAYERALRANPDYVARRAALERWVKHYEAFYNEGSPFSQVVEIPVVFHVLENPEIPEVTDGQILEALDRLNNDYSVNRRSEVRPEFTNVVSATRIQFVLARRDSQCEAVTSPGIHRVPVELTEFAASTCQYASEGSGTPSWGLGYLNVWIAPIAEGSLVLGSSTFPAHSPVPFPGPGLPPVCGLLRDGVIVVPEAITGPRGTETLTHEVGHWLNLVHVENPSDILGYRDTCAGTTEETCASEGDAVCDTPSDASIGDTCGTRPDSCEDTYGDEDLPDQWENYMVAVDRGCQVAFTFGQVARMEASLAYVAPPELPGVSRGMVLDSAGHIPPVPGGDPWSSDGAGDTGAEPNEATEAIWASNDIWLRRQPDGREYQQHENPVHTPGALVYVYVRIRNRGCAATEQTTVTLRWAKSSPSLGWPAPWDGTTDTGCGDGAPMGGLVATATVPVIEPGGSYIAEFRWDDFPNPTDYECADADETHFCLLSHIGDLSMSPRYLGQLVAGSNDVVWKNVTILGDVPTLGNGHDTGATSVGPPPGGGTSDLEFTGPDAPGTPSVFHWGTVEVDLGAGLFARWVEGGMAGDGIASVDGTVVTLQTSGAVLQNILMAPGDLFTLRVRMRPEFPFPTRGGLDIYHLDVTQRAGGNLVGGVRLIRETRYPPRPSLG